MLLKTRQPAIAATILALSIVAPAAIASPASAAETVEVRASDYSGHTVSFEPPRVAAEAVERASVRSGDRSRALALAKARRAVESGRLKVQVSDKAHRRLRTNRREDGRAGVRRWLRNQVLVLKRKQERQSGAQSGAQAPVPAPGPRSAYMLISAERLASLPTSGPAYDYMKQQADAALSSMNLGPTPDSTSPWLPNYNGAGSVRRPGVQTLAAALVYARTGEQRYRDLVVSANRYLIGSEDSASTDGTADRDRTLATARNIGAFVVAADLVGMDGNATGSRPGYEGKTWNGWLAELRTKTIGAPANCNSLVQCSDERAHNWAMFATGARISIDIYLGDQADLDEVVRRLRFYLGETDAGPAWRLSADFDLSYACLGGAASLSAGINGSGCGAAKDGMIVEDISRSSGAFPSYDETGIAYTMEAYQGLLFSAILLERQGYDVFSWGNQALRRVMDWLTREGKPQGNGSSVERHLSWVPQYFYGQSYSTVPAGMGRTLGFTDWLFAV